MSEANVKKLLEKIYRDPNSVDEWLRNPHDKTKEWNHEVEDDTVDIIRTTVQYVSQEFQEFQNVTQRTMKKINEASRHALFSFYTAVAVNILTFVLGVIIFCLGTYAFFKDYNVLGFFFCMVGIAKITYFLLVKPLQGLNQNIGDLVQMEMAIGSWLNEMNYWRVFIKDSQLEDKQIVAQAMRDAAKWAIMLIEDYTNPNRKKTMDANTYANLMAKANAKLDKLRTRDPETKSEKLLTTDSSQEQPSTDTNTSSANEAPATEDSKE